MDFNTYDIWRFVHVLLFVYWLGADLGVYYAAKYVNRPDLSLAERKRFLELTLLLDMGPRTGLVLLLPVGFQMWFMSPLNEEQQRFLLPIWVISLIWLAIVWIVHTRKGTDLSVRLRKIEFLIRYIVIAFMGILGLLSLLEGEPIYADWLSLKIFLYACVLIVGLYLRKILKDFSTGFEMLEANENDQHANTLISEATVKGERGALLLWFLVAVVAYLGVAKPL